MGKMHAAGEEEYSPVKSLGPHSTSQSRRNSADPSLPIRYISRPAKEALIDTLYRAAGIEPPLRNGGPLRGQPTPSWRS